MNQDLNKLEIFKEVVIAGSFTKAAKTLKQPKSRISRQIASLERDLGVQLIYRTTRQFQLTQTGQELYERIFPILTELNNTLDNLNSEAQEVSGVIKLTVADDIGSELMGKICREFMDLYPKVQIGLHTGNQVVDLVKDSIDVAIRISKTKDSTMSQKKLGSVEMVFVLSPALYKKYDLRKLEDLEKIPFMAFESLTLRPQVLKVSNTKETRTLKFKPIFGSNNFLVLRSMALQDAGLVQIPSFLAQNYIQRGELIQVFKEWKTEGTPIQILYPQQKEMPLRIRKFIDFIAPKLMQYF